MVVFPLSKINLGLRIVGRRSDGYHLLDTMFYPIPLTDILELTPLAEGGQDSLVVYGNDAVPASSDNLVLRAISALRRHFEVPPLQVSLYKGIPSGAGLGGGSSDASYALAAVAELLELPVTMAELREVALALGADCPFFVEPQPSIGQGIGERLTPMPSFSLSGYHIVVVYPRLHVSTAEAFRGLGQLQSPEESVAEVLARPIEEWRGRLINDFEASLFPQYPKLGELKEWLYGLGAVYASMSGSGSALYGIFTSEVSLPHLSDCFVWQSPL